MKPTALNEAKGSARNTGRRTLALLIVFSLAFTYLAIRIFCLQVFGYGAYQKKVMDQITVSSSLRAERGKIYDASGNILAESQTVYRIYISPKNIAIRQRKVGYSLSDTIADGLASLLGLSREEIYGKTQRIRVLDVTLKKEVDEALCQKVLSFIADNDLAGLVNTEASTKRYYPYGGLAAHTIGFAGSDNQGLFGLEYYYDDDLRGEDGAYLSAVDAHGNGESYHYTTYKAPQNGLHLVTTIDAYIQSELESELMRIIEDFDVKNRTTGIVMNVKTGAILAMATAPTFDLNDPYTLDPLSLALLSGEGLSEGSAEYTQRKNELRLEMWKNKAVSELYEPGSTFKIMTAAMAFDSGATTLSDHSYFCGGSYSPVKGVRISCWRKIGHGSAFTFSYGLQQSCNCALMQVAAKIGSDTFYNYFKAFGFLEKTGIDLPSEAASLFHTKEALGVVELATSSFGQRFKVTPLAELCAIAAVANGGQLVTPHLIDKLIDEHGNTVYQYEPTVKKQAVSKEAADTVSAILEEGVSGTGASRNAYAKGFRIAAKTGTSEKLDKQDANGGYSLRIGSCAAFAPYDDTEIAMIILVDEPTTAHFGATVAAPYISSLTAKIMPYLGYEAVYTEKEAEMEPISIGHYVGMTVKEARSALQKLGISALFEGENSDVITGQLPTAGTILHKSLGRVVLYTEKEPKNEVKVPDLIGLTVKEANEKLLDAGLNIRLLGSLDKTKGGDPPTATYQSHEKGTILPRGSTVEVRFLYNDKE